MQAVGKVNDYNYEFDEILSRKGIDEVLYLTKESAYPLHSQGYKIRLKDLEISLLSVVAKCYSCFLNNRKKIV